MVWNEFEQSVREGQLRSVYLFVGPEGLKKSEALETLRSVLLPVGLEQLNESRFEGASAQQIIDAAETLPVMCERRLVIVRDWQPFFSAKAKNEDADTQRMLDYLKNPPDTAVIVFYLSKEPADKKWIGELRKTHGVMFSRLEGQALAKWCAEQLRETGKKLQSRAFSLLTDMAGSDLTRLSGELKKLSAYVQNAPEITPDDVRAVVTPTPEYRAYEILDHLLAGRIVEAEKIVNSVLQGSMNSVQLIVQLANALRIDAHVKLAAESGGNIDAALTALKIQSGRAYFVKRQIRLLPASAFQTRYLACTKAQFEVTSGSLRDRAALDALLLKIAV